MPAPLYDTKVEVAVAKQMAKVTERLKTSFNLALGDNFYFDGVTDVDDVRFKVYLKMIIACIDDIGDKPRDLNSLKTFNDYNSINQTTI